MKTIQNDFSKELSKVFNKYQKTLQVDKNGIFVVDNEMKLHFFIGIPESATEDNRDSLIFGYESFK